MNHFEFAGMSIKIFESVTAALTPDIIFGIGGIIILLMAWWYIARFKKQTTAITYSDLRLVRRAHRSTRGRLRGILPVLRILALASLLVAFARPRSGTETTNVSSEGVDIMLVLDISSSMQAEDFAPHNRLYVAKEEIKKFIARRPTDRIGLVVFARNAFTQCPLTIDHTVLLSLVDKVGIGLVEDGTAIGMGLVTAVNRLRDSEAKSKIIVLLTDGDNNAGEIDPLTAANTAAALDLKVYTIGAGKPGNAMFPYQDPLFGKRYVYQPTKIDEETLKQIADITGGRYFRARSGEELDQIYTMIDSLEKTEIEISNHIQYRELFHYFVYAGLALLALEMLLANSVLRKLP